jgi:hypothetical protein
MVPEEYTIPLSALFTIFLTWLIAHLTNQFCSHTPHKGANEEAGTNNDHSNHHSDLSERIHNIEAALKDALYLLAIPLILNSLRMAGDKTTIEVLSLIAMFSAILSCGSELMSLGLIRKGFWIIFVASVFAIWVTAFATPR